MRDTYLGQVGTTPLVPVDLGDGPVWCKLEYLNPSGSIKDRIALFILRKALRSGALQEGDEVVEASSGSTSIAMALVCAQLGLQFCAVMPEDVSAERITMLRCFGASVVLTPASDGIRGALARAERLRQQRVAFWPRQFSNIDNAETHRRWTAHEIMSQIPGGQVDAVVSGVGTGGTIVGLYQGVMDHGGALVAMVARPTDGTAITDMECCSFSGRIPGVVDGLSQIFRPDEMEQVLYVDVPDALAMETTKRLIRAGFPVGPSSGLNYAAAVLGRAQCPHALRRMVTVFPDRMERYFSTGLFDHPGE